MTSPPPHVLKPAHRDLWHAAICLLCANSCWVNKSLPSASPASVTSLKNVQVMWQDSVMRTDVCIRRESWASTHEPVDPCLPSMVGVPQPQGRQGYFTCPTRSHHFRI